MHQPVCCAAAPATPAPLARISSSQQRLPSRLRHVRTSTQSACARGGVTPLCGREAACERGAGEEQRSSIGTVCIALSHHTCCAARVS